MAKARKTRDAREPVEHHTGPAMGPNTTGDADMAMSAQQREEPTPAQRPRRATKGRTRVRAALPKTAETPTED